MRIIGNDPNTPRQTQRVASGTLPNGKPVVVNSDGTVSVAGETSYSESLSSGTVYNTNNTIRVAAGFDSANNKVVIAYYDYGTTSGQAVVGTVSGDTISFGTQVQFSSNVDADTTISFDTANEKVVIFYRNQDNSNYGTAIVGTVSGNSISFGTPVVFSSYYAQYNSSAYDSTSGKVIVANRDGSVTDDGRAFVGTVSGTSISFGSAQTFQSGNTNRVGLIYDASVDRIVVVYLSGATTKSRVGTISGSTISFGTEQTLGGSSPGNLNIAGDNNGTVFVGYSEGGASDPLYALLATIGTSSLTAGSRVTVDSYVPGFDVVYDSAFDKWVVLYRVNTPSNAGKYRVGSASGTTLTFETAVTYYNNNAEDVELTFDSNSNKVVFVYRDSGDGGKGTARVFQNAGSLTNLTAENYIGMSSGVVEVTGSAEQEIGSETVFESGNTQYTATAYDTVNDKIVIVYEDVDNSQYATAVVGTVSGNTISFGTPVVFRSANTDQQAIVFDENAGKFLIFYRDNSNAQGYGIVGTVSGTSISFGSAVQFNSSNNPVVMSASYDSTAQKCVLVWRANGASDVGRAKVATISGTSVSFGSVATYNNGTTGWCSVAYDANANKHVVAYEDGGNSNKGTAVVGTVSGTSISFGSEVVFCDDASRIATVYDSTAQKIVIAYRDEINNNYGTAIVGTVSGTSISFGTPTVFEAAATLQVSAVYDATADKVVVVYNDQGNSAYGTIAVGDVDGTDITFTDPEVFNTAETENTSCAYDPDQGKVVVAYRDVGNNNGAGTTVVVTTGYENISRYPVADGDNASLDIIGSVSTNQLSLTAGEKYYVQTDGTISTTAGSPSVLAGTAISATKLVVKT